MTTNRTSVGGQPGGIRVLVGGFGVMTRGVIPHLLDHPTMKVTLTSRHLTSTPDARLELVRRADLRERQFDVVLGCFESDDASQQFWTSPDLAPVLRDGRPGCIEMSTLSHPQALSWYEHLGALGCPSIESPVTGSRPRATEGTLSAFAYASARHPPAEQVLAVFTERRYDFSQPGNPTLFKLIYNAWGAALLDTLATFARPMREQLSDDFDVARDVIMGDGWMSLVATSKLDRMLSEDFSDPDFALGHMIKDVTLAGDVLDTSEYLPSLLARYQHAADAFGLDVDYTAVTAVPDGPRSASSSPQNLHIESV
jgi:3-hydroxyisobutyrate dehydrogenase